MTLEELRIELLDSVRNCPHPNSVGELIADAVSKLNASNIGEHDKKAFWDAVDHDLVVVTQEASMIMEINGAQSLRTAIGVARAAIVRYRGGSGTGRDIR